jgi:hypothetical protein
MRAMLAWLTMPGFGRRWRYLAEHAFPGPAYLQQRYGDPPGGLWPLHYLRRFSLAGWLRDADALGEREGGSALCGLDRLPAAGS